MFILKKGHQPGVYVPLRALFLVVFAYVKRWFSHNAAHLFAFGDIDELC